MPVTQEAGEYTTQLATRYAENPMLGIVDNLGLGTGLTEGLRVYVGVLAAVILTIATNAGLIGLSRLAFSMGQHRQLPQLVRAIHPRFKTPYMSIIVFAALSVLALIPGETELLATMYSFGAMLSFTVAHLAVLRLRRVQAERERPWRPPGNVRIRGYDVPLTALLGGLGTFSAWIVVMALNLRTLAIGMGWMLLGISIYLLYRRHQGLPLRQTVKVESLEALGVEEVEYRSVLVAFPGGEPFSQESVATASALASRRRRGIHVLALVEVPMSLPPDASMKSEVSAAQSKIERAKLICGMRVSGQVERVRPGQSGAAIIDRAKELDAAAIVMQLPYRDGTPLYGRTLQTVLARRPCRVIVAATPEHARPSEELVRGGGSGGLRT
jgi:APA family basic amino acid/polyamine antiporter